MPVTSPSAPSFDAAVRAFGWSGLALPELMLSGNRLAPVAVLDHVSRRARLTGALFVARRGWQRALREARSWRGLGPTAVLAPDWAFADEECRLEFAVHGIGLGPLVPFGEDDLVMPEPGGPVPADRWIEETLYRHAVDHGLRPQH